MYRKAREGGGVDMDRELATGASRFVECRLVPVVEGFQEKVVNTTQTDLFDMLPGEYYALVWKLKPRNSSDFGGWIRRSNVSEARYNYTDSKSTGRH